MKRCLCQWTVALVSVLLLTTCSGCGILGGGLLGGIIGHQSGEAVAGAVIGAAVCGAGDIARAVDDLSKPKCKPKPKECTVTVNIRNENGSYTPVRLTKKGGEYIGPQGEHYVSLPTEEQLRPYYGMETPPEDASPDPLPERAS